MSNHHLYVPENLDIESLKKYRPRAFYSRNLKEENLLYICAAIIKARYNQRKKMDDQGTKFAPVSSVLLDDVVHNYPRYIEYLLLMDVIETDNHFIVGEKCRGYCFKSPYRGQPLKRVEAKSYCLRKSIRQAAEKWETERKKELKEYGYLTKWWDNLGLEIDIDGAYEWIENYKEEKQNAILRDEEITDREERLLQLVDTCEDFKRQVFSIYTRDFSYRFIGEGHRFYSPITNLKKELRAFLTYKGQPMMELDKKNSQPYFSLALMRPSFWHAEAKEPNRLFFRDVLNPEMVKEISGGREKPRIGTLLHGVITLLKNEETYAHKGYAKIQKYVDCVTGDFYEHIQDIFQPLYPDRFDTRDNVKKEVMRILYMDPKVEHHPFYAPAITFRGQFPFVYGLFKMLKEREHNTLALILQRIESHLFIDVICKQIHASHPHIPLYTIHDCILTTKGNENTVKAIIEEELERWMGYPATLHCKEITKEYSHVA